MLYIQYVTLSMLLFIINKPLRVVCAQDYQQTCWPPPPCSHLECKWRERRNMESGCTRYAHYISPLFCITNYLTGTPPTTALENELRHSFSRVIDTAANRDVMRRGFIPSLLCFVPHRHDERGETLSCCVSFTYKHDERGFTPSCRVSFDTDAMRGGKPSPVVFLSYTNAMSGGFTYPFSSRLFRHRRDERGETLSCRVSFTYKCDEQGFTPSRCVSFDTDATRGGKPSPVVFSLQLDMTRGGFPLLCCVSFHTDTTRGG